MGRIGLNKFINYYRQPEDEKRSLSGHIWGGGESESDSLVADVDDNRGYNEDGSFVSKF
jgi:hypothetical protein